MAACLLAAQVLAAADHTKDAAALLARAFKAVDEAHVELSIDGEWILTLARVWPMECATAATGWRSSACTRSAMDGAWRRSAETLTAAAIGNRAAPWMWHRPPWRRSKAGWEFSADSRALFATSKYLRRWDVSALR